MTKKEQVILLSEKHIKDVPGFPKPGIIFKDIVPVFEDPEYLQMVFDVMVDELKENNIQFDKIVCPEARGFLFGPTLGLLTKKGVVILPFSSDTLPMVPSGLSSSKKLTS